MNVYFDLLKQLEEITGAKLYFVGGTSRDILLGEHPKDIDIATPENVHNIMKRLKKYAIKDQKALPFGVAKFKFGEYDLDITEFRTEVYTEGNRKPKVEHTDSMELDYQRRDFTINGIYLGSDGQPIFFGTSEEDFKNMNIQIIGSKERYREDPLRILRHIRFAAKYNKEVPECFDELGLVSNLLRMSDEKTWGELIRIFNTKGGFRCFVDGWAVDVLFPSFNFRNFTDNHKLSISTEEQRNAVLESISYLSPEAQFAEILNASIVWSDSEYRQNALNHMLKQSRVRFGFSNEFMLKVREYLK